MPAAPLILPFGLISRGITKMNFIHKPKVRTKKSFQLSAFSFQRHQRQTLPMSVSSQKQRGFTLLEILLYLVIFSSVIGAIISLSNTAISQRVKNQVTSDVNYQAEATLASIIQAIQSASSVTTPTLGGNSASLTLVMPNSATNPTIYDTYNDGLTTRLRLREGSPAVSNYLTSSHAVLSNLSFTNAGVPGSKGSIKIQFDLAYKNGGTRQEFVYTKTYYGTANIR